MAGPFTESRVEPIIENATFSATITSPTISNDGRVTWVVLAQTGAITTTPTLTITINVSVDGINWYPASTATAISAANTKQRTILSVNSAAGPIVEPFIQIVAAFGGSGNFANTIVSLVGL